MRSTSDDFRTSVEFDIHQKAYKLDFLIDYTFVSLQLNTPNFKRFILKKDDEEYVLEVRAVNELLDDEGFEILE